MQCALGAKRIKLTGARTQNTSVAPRSRAQVPHHESRDPIQVFYHPQTRLPRVQRKLPTQMDPAKRRRLRRTGILMAVLGAIMFFLGAIAGFLGMINADSGTSPLIAFGGFGVTALGIFTGAIGMFLINLTLLRPLGDIVATETQGAIEVTASALGRGLSSGGIGGSTQQVIRIRCPSCGYLESEDAKFCSGCGGGI